MKVVEVKDGDVVNCFDLKAQTQRCEDQDRGQNHPKAWNHGADSSAFALPHEKNNNTPTATLRAEGGDSGKPPPSLKTTTLTALHQTFASSLCWNSSGIPSQRRFAWRLKSCEDTSPACPAFGRATVNVGTADATSFKSGNSSRPIRNRIDRPNPGVLSINPFDSNVRSMCSAIPGTFSSTSGFRFLPPARSR